MVTPIPDVTTSEWKAKVLQSKKPVAVDFWHENCVWCKRLDPVLAEVASAKSKDMAFFKLHVFKQPDISRKYGIQGTPTVKFFCGGREVHEIVGFRPKDALAKEIDMVLERWADCLKQSTPVPGD